MADIEEPYCEEYGSEDVGVLCVFIGPVRRKENGESLSQPVDGIGKTQVIGAERQSNRGAIGGRSARRGKT